jgi:DtxR family Mn-dependent transcriptional regulator
MATSTVEDYLKHIYFAQTSIGQDLVPMGELAKRLAITPGTATTMIKALTDAGLTEYEPRVGVRLSHAGLNLALTVVRKHRIVEQFLVDALKMDWSEVHEEAEHLEHTISDKVLEKMDEYLGFPRFDPHGDPIPDAVGNLSHRQLSSLEDIRQGETVRIARILDQNPEFLEFVERKGLRPGNTIQLLSVDNMAETVSLDIGGDTVVTISQNLTKRIEVEST